MTIFGKTKVLLGSAGHAELLFDKHNTAMEPPLGHHCSTTSACLTAGQGAWCACVQGVGDRKDRTEGKEQATEEVVPGMVTLQGRHLVAPSISIPFLQFI